MSEVLLVGGFEPFSTTDWPGKLCAVVFVQGCPWRCGYCHNPGLQPRQRPEGTPHWRDILVFLEHRRGLLDGVVFSGGEPTIDPGLGDAITQVRDLGFQVGLHTAGIHTRRLISVLPQVDWIGLDLKAGEAAHDRITGVPGSARAGLDALTLVAGSGVEVEVRTTFDPGLLDDLDLLEMARTLRGTGVGQWTLQRRRWLQPEPHMAPPPSQRLLDEIGQLGLRIQLR
ncbi:anaerobic ribonucleoside-triphosphate reductase activating protein [Azohydromonas lata]|uniref:Anaerobic ribonucleoside-triphosphate reductase activating protein n=1 Tax=Azohydromonas lata TaxID=45677 RepID=A0ABU5IG97_9BURK|nr:anaerobic ribonucleoside-triphosphate reductase activating protein [Azohydromonas lata]MDZ5457958.1 anaerobic ribonucleoside-triphosphate reductase activating protein [Azohydromonas lata]